MLNASSNTGSTTTNPESGMNKVTKMKSIDPAGSSPRAAAGSLEPRMLEAISSSSAALLHHHPFGGAAEEENKDGDGDHFSGSNVTVAHGKTASLNCRIRGSISNNTVMEIVVFFIN